MREIKFRAWNRSKNRMETVNLIKWFELQYSQVSTRFNDKQTGKIIDDWHAYGQEDGADNVILMQYIGLHDKNGKDIYEGDIFKFDDEIWSSCYTDCGTEYNSFKTHEQYASVEFMYGKFDLINFKYHDSQVCADLNENDEMAFYEFASENEVVGNIYENPELLKLNDNEINDYY